MPKTTYELAKTTSELKKKIAKLEKEIKKHQNFIDKLSVNLMFVNPLLFNSLLQYRSKGAKGKSSSAKKTPRLKGKKNLGIRNHPGNGGD